VLEGAVTGRCTQRHQHEEFVRFLNPADRTVATGKAIEPAVDNYVTHKN
jgi:hypothetical protein